MTSTPSFPPHVLQFQMHRRVPLICTMKKRKRGVDRIDGDIGCSACAVHRGVLAEIGAAGK